jgi:CheY-like chemotaxis protein
VQPDIGFRPAAGRPATDVIERLQQIGLAAVKKRFSPEFVNRIDAIITYQPLDTHSLSLILDAHVAELQKHVNTRLGDRSFDIQVTPAARALLLERGVSQEYGARELKRTIHRLLTQPLAALVADGKVAAGGKVVVDRTPDDGEITLLVERRATARDERTMPLVLILDDNAHVAEWVARVVEGEAAKAVVAGTAGEAIEVAARDRLDLAIVDMMLPDGDGLSVAFELLRMWPRIRIVIMTGGDLSPEENIVSERHDFHDLRKPFNAEDITNVVRATFLRASEAAN